MKSLDLNYEGYDINLDENENNDNINLHLFEQLYGKKYKIEESNKMQETAIKAIIFKENNNTYPTISFQDTKNFLSESFNFGKTETESNNLLNRKRKQEIFDDENNDNKNFEENNFEEDNLEKKEDIISKRGRRKKNVKYDKKPGHDKFKEDNVIQKIKTFIFDYILEQLNKSLKYSNHKFYPLSKKINSDLKKDFNEELLEKTIYDIYMTSDLNNRYLNINDANKELIKKIYKEKVEIEAINILEKKFKDILEYIREKDLNNFLTNFRLREIKKDDKDIDNYMKAVEKWLFNYEFYFKRKLNRNYRKD